MPRVAALGCPLKGTGQGAGMEDLECPVASTLLSFRTAKIQRKGQPIQLVQGWLQELPEGFVMHNQQPMGLHSGFSVGVYSPGHSHFHGIRKAAKVFCQNFPSLYEAGSTGLHGTRGRPCTTLYTTHCCIGNLPTSSCLTIILLIASIGRGGQDLSQ